MVHDFARSVHYRGLKSSPVLEEIEDRSMCSSCSYPKGIVRTFVPIMIMVSRFIFSSLVIESYPLWIHVNLGRSIPRMGRLTTAYIQSPFSDKNGTNLS